MKYLLFIVLLVIFYGCSDDDTLSLIIDLDNPTAMNVFCQSTPTDTLSRYEYEYHKDKINLETVCRGDDTIRVTSYKYNSVGLLLKETIESDLIKFEKDFEYNSSEQLVKIIYKTYQYDMNGKVLNDTYYEAPLHYENNKLIKEWVYYGDWAGYNTYEYSNGLVSTKTHYSKNGATIQYIIRYSYSSDKLVKEIKESVTDYIFYSKTYHYDSNSRLISIVDRENTIEEYSYSDNHLIEKRTFYYGIDPCFAQCCGNFIYKYEY